MLGSEHTYGTFSFIPVADFGWRGDGAIVPTFKKHFSQQNRTKNKFTLPRMAWINDFNLKSPLPLKSPKLTTGVCQVQDFWTLIHILVFSRNFIFTSGSHSVNTNFFFSDYLYRWLAHLTHVSDNVHNRILLLTKVYHIRNFSTQTFSNRHCFIDEFQS
jgi:hypothetical protein